MPTVTDQHHLSLHNSRNNKAMNALSFTRHITVKCGCRCSAAIVGNTSDATWWTAVLAKRKSTSVSHTRESRLNGPRYQQNALHHTTWKDASVFLMPHFAILDPNECIKERHPSRQRKSDQYPMISWKCCEIGRKYYSLTGSRIRASDWYRKRWLWMTLNRVIAVIVRHFTQSDSFQVRNWSVCDKNVAERF